MTTVLLARSMTGFAGYFTEWQLKGEEIHRSTGEPS
jgi:hypothetical protein